MRENPFSVVCEQQRRRPACASAQSDQRLCYSRVLESIISRLAMSEIVIFYLVSTAEENGLKLALSETPKTGFLATRLNYKENVIVII